MRHYGDITKINGADVPPVDVITGGSPCQDLSVAGKRAGLAGERSGLYMEQIRVIKEMREADVLRGRTGIFVRPRYMVWENVPGAFSSNKGRDFAAVLEEAIRIAEPQAPDVPVPEKGWSKSGCLYDEMGRWSVAWRTHDAQYWGVAQRRKRIALLVDFGGLTAGDIMFDPQLLRKTTDSSGVKAFADTGDRRGCLQVPSDPQGMPWNPEQSGTERQGTAGGSADCTGAASTFCLQGNGIDRADTAGCNGKGWREDVSYTLNTIDRPAVYCYDMDNERRRGPDQFENVSPAILARAGTGGNNVLAVYDARGNGTGDIVPTITGDHENRIAEK